MSFPDYGSLLVTAGSLIYLSLAEQPCFREPDAVDEDAKDG